MYEFISPLNGTAVIITLFHKDGSQENFLKKDSYYPQIAVQVCMQLW